MSEPIRTSIEGDGSERPGTAADTTDYKVIRSLNDAQSLLLAYDRVLDRAVVLHLLPDAGPKRTRLVESARALARVSHMSLASVYRVRESGDRPCIVQSFERGERLDQMATPWPTDRVLTVGRGIAGALAALHEAGTAHGDVRAEHIVYAADGVPRLFGLSSASSNESSECMSMDVQALLTLLAQVAEPDQRPWIESLAEDGGQRAPTAAQVVAALSIAANDKRPLSDENPYRGLRPYEARHAGLFFGRRIEIDAALETLRHNRWLLITGPSGTGKSSLVRAGIAPPVSNGDLGERRQWDVVNTLPGFHPLLSLAESLAGLFELNPATFVRDLRDEPSLVAKLARERPGRGFMLFVDQFEEVFTELDEGERQWFMAVVAGFSLLTPGVRLVLAMRSDFLGDLAALGRHGRDLLRAALLLPPLRADDIRAAVVGPARARGYEFETERMVTSLTRELDGGEGTLPLLSFVLSELWNERDETRRVLPEAALDRLGGASAALARHCDNVLATMSVETRRCARRILLKLVSPGETRHNCSHEELLAPSVQASDLRDRELALDALVRGRLVVAGDRYELAHEALIKDWARLRDWLDEASESRRVAFRLTAAANEWSRLGRVPDALLGERELLHVTRLLPAANSALEAEFLARSAVAVDRARSRRRRLAAALLLATASLGGLSWGLATWRRHRTVARAIEAAERIAAHAEATAQEVERRRTRAFEAFDRDDLSQGEAAWKDVLVLEEALDRERSHVCASLDEAFALAPRDARARALCADASYARLLSAERLHQPRLIEQLHARLELYDDGSREARWVASGHVRIQTEPREASWTLARYRDDGGRLLAEPIAVAGGSETLDLAPGSYLAVAECSLCSATRYPFVVRRGETELLSIQLPRKESIPKGMIYVPGGTTFYGTSDDEAVRGLQGHQPMHPIINGPFLIAATEVTNGDYLEFSKTPYAEARQGSLADWQHLFRSTGPGLPYCNGIQPCVDGALLPVGAMSRLDGERYAKWLNASGRLPGARLCTDREWERAARGADDRRFPSGNGLAATADACTFAAYGRDELKMGPCAAGSYPASASPFGVMDLMGNYWEWTSTPAEASEPQLGVLRGGDHGEDAVGLVIGGRMLRSAKHRERSMGIRICATIPP